MRFPTLSGRLVATRQHVELVQVPIKPNQFVAVDINVRWPVQVRQSGLGRHVYAIGLSAPTLDRYDTPSTGWQADYIAALPPMRVTVQRSTGVEEFESLAPDPSILAFGQATWILPRGRRSLLLDVETRNVAVRRLVELLGDLLFLGAGFLLGAAGTHSDRSPGIHGATSRGTWLPRKLRASGFLWALAALLTGIALLVAAAIAIPGNVYDQTFVYSGFWSWVFFAVPLFVMTAGIVISSMLLRNELKNEIPPPANPWVLRWLYHGVYRKLYQWVYLLPGLALVWVATLTALEVSRDDWPSVSSGAGIGALLFLTAGAVWLDPDAQ